MKPANYLERLFLAQIAKANVPMPIYSRFDGHLIARWESPCPEVGFLNVRVDKFPEIVTSCKITHEHFSRHHYERDTTGAKKHTRRKQKRLLVSAAVKNISQFLSGKSLVSKCVDEKGAVRSTGSTPWLLSAEEIAKNDQRMSEIHKCKVTEKYYTWFGEYHAK